MISLLGTQYEEKRTLYYEFPRYASETNKIRKNIEKEVKDEKWEAD